MLENCHFEGKVDGNRQSKCGTMHFEPPHENSRAQTGSSPTGSPARAVRNILDWLAASRNCPQESDPDLAAHSGNL